MDAVCPECKKIFRTGDTVAISQDGQEGCNICSYKKKDESIFVPLVDKKARYIYQKKQEKSQ